MKKIILAFLLIMGVSFFSYSQDYPVIAKEYCNCFTSTQDSMDAEFRQILIKVSKQPDIKKAFLDEMKNMGEEKGQRFAQQLEIIGNSMNSNETAAGRCGIALDEKYKEYISTPEKEKEFYEKIIQALKGMKDCEFFTAIMVFSFAFAN
jgi:hypothetical protein